MTPEQLITFATVAEHGNISHAANALHLSQPAVSGQLKLLQEAFGEPLYQRAGRGVRLTAAGEQLLGHAERLRETFRQAQALRDAMRGLERGTLRIGASTTPASYLLPYLLADFHGRYPDVVVTTTNGNTSEIVAALETLDIALIEGPPGQELALGTEVTAWREDEIVAIVPGNHPLASGSQTQLLDVLGAYPLVLRESGSGVRQLVERAFAREGVAMRVALEIAGVEGVKEAVRAGMGIGFVSAMSIRHEDNALHRLGIAPQPLTRHFSILMPHAATPSRAAARFMELCLCQ
ncbi:LysR family transcriptional regulator [Pseudomonas guariconensis]|uniref:LysR family transcriptional regulator n=1 Tax=Pseudomonas guariconensis TaxID=1288410 RepID=UPI0018AC27C9|nr:LysR family transcriptional regulator [Pseudomonas guariconensis]MBF8739736.1 LysR family transcriptional regulator [Pseudomonas guariconensis]MBF8749120.1 LysR family transcriptional regulator [Pseudomonas guariconensis]